MDTDAKGQIGGIECSKEARQRMAQESQAWKCSACGKTNVEVMKERQDMVDEIEAKEGKRKDEEVPEELRLAYRDELGAKDEGIDKGKGRAAETAAQAPPKPASAPAPAADIATSVPATSTARSQRPPPTVRAPALQQLAPPSPDRYMALLDTCIYGIVAALLFMVLKRFA